MKRGRAKAKRSTDQPGMALESAAAVRAAGPVPIRGGGPAGPYSGSCVWMGGADDNGDCTACGKRHGVPGCGDPDGTKRRR